MKDLVRITILALVFLLSSTEIAIAGNTNMIKLEQLEDMFANMRATSKWDVDRPLLWGYFFTDKKPEKLEPVKKELIKNGYHFVDIYPTDDHSTFFLHVEKIEHHTPQSLNQRNLTFYKLADKYQIESYDGMDVGPVK